MYFETYRRALVVIPFIHSLWRCKSSMQCLRVIMRIDCLHTSSLVILRERGIPLWIRSIHYDVYPQSLQNYKLQDYSIPSAREPRDLASDANPPIYLTMMRIEDPFPSPGVCDTSQNGDHIINRGTLLWSMIEWSSRCFAVQYMECNIWFIYRNVQESFCS